ncbi:MAG: hypothetical protein RLZ36_42 [Pseudomonadota bacterium]|jgi:type III restriction enzyme
MTTSHFQLESLTYQTDAVHAALQIFDGTPKPATPEVIGNRCPLTWDQLATNLQAVAQRHQISQERLCLTSPQAGEPLELCIEMETGTGKTLVYLRTLYRLHTVYGWNKFIIVVPSVAIRAGVMGTLADFGAQLAQQNGLTFPIAAFEYDSSRLQQLKTFIDSPTPAIMVINSQAFVGKGKIISNEETEAPLDGLTWLQALARCRPIVVMDEPQEGMDTDAALAAFADMKPLAKLRYSATHKQARNCIYRLTPAQAYNQGLVKKIEVLTIAEQNDAGLLQLELTDTQTRAGQSPKAKLKLWFRNTKGELQYKASNWLSRQADLADLTHNPSYTGWCIDHIEKSMETGQWQVRFDNGHTLVQGQPMGHDKAGLFQLQLRWLIHRHFEKKARLAPLGIKCLSLVFIDKVANYLGDGQTEVPLIKRLFEEEYTARLTTLSGQAPTDDEVQKVQGSYFAQTGQGKYTDSESAMSKNSGIYKRILTDKAGLLRLDDPIEFIFSHSALGVGWDNPNVFNIATLNTAQSHDRKRQELGRGLRICVNQQGQRVYDAPDTPLGEEINLLTVVPNLSYQEFAEGYQQEIEEAYVTKLRGVWCITDEGRAVAAAPYDGPAFLKELQRRYRVWKASQSIVPAEEEAEEEPVFEQPEDRMASILRNAHEALAAELIENIKLCEPAFFEKLVLDLLLKMGYGRRRENAGRTVGQAGDGGVDGIINEDPLGLDTIYLQAKRWEGAVGEGPIRDFIGALDIKGVKKGVFLTTSYYTPAAKAAVEGIRSDKKVVLIDGAHLARLMIEHDLGVSVAKTFALKRLDSDFFAQE